jgi:hypothetical protein
MARRGYQAASTAWYGSVSARPRSESNTATRCAMSEGSVSGKKGTDKGIDGRLYFHEGLATNTKQVILSMRPAEHQCSDGA